MELELKIFIIVFIVATAAAFIQRVTGFGLGIFVMLFLPQFMSPLLAATISCLFSCFTSSYNAVKYRKDVSYKTVFPLTIASLCVIPVAVYFAASISANAFEIFLGVVLILLSFYFLFFEKKIRIRAIPGNGVIAGALGGALNGLFSTGGPPIVIYLTQASKDNITYFASIQFYFCITNIYATVFRFINGAVTKTVLLYTAVGFIGCLLGDFIGKKVFDRLNFTLLKRIIYFGMILSGITMIL